MTQLNIFDYLTSEEIPKAGDTIINQNLEKGVVLSVSDEYIKAKFKDVTTLTPKKAFKYFYKVVKNG